MGRYLHLGYWVLIEPRLCITRWQGSHVRTDQHSRIKQNGRALGSLGVSGLSESIQVSNPIAAFDGTVLLILNILLLIIMLASGADVVIVLEPLELQFAKGAIAKYMYSGRWDLRGKVLVLPDYAPWMS